MKNLEKIVCCSISDKALEAHAILQNYTDHDSDADRYMNIKFEIEVIPEKDWINTRDSSEIMFKNL